MPIELNHDFAHPAAQVWAIVGTPDRTDWVPGVESCEFVDGVRSMQMQGAGLVRERILTVDEDKQFIEYSVIESAVPLASHLASITIEETSTGCRLTWRTTVDPLAVEPFIVDSMKAALVQLEKILNGD